MRLLSTIRTTTLRTSVAGLALTLALAGCSVGTTAGAGSTTSTPQSSMREARASEEKPPNTTVCGAPIRAQASIATAASGIIGR